MLLKFISLPKKKIRSIFPQYLYSQPPAASPLSRRVYLAIIGHGIKHRLFVKCLQHNLRKKLIQLGIRYRLFIIQGHSYSYFQCKIIPSTIRFGCLTTWWSSSSLFCKKKEYSFSLFLINTKNFLWLHPIAWKKNKNRCQVT